MIRAALIVAMLVCAVHARATLEVRGVTVLSSDELETLVETHAGGQAVSAAQVVALIGALNDAYRSRGYVTSGARPARDANGKLYIEVTEGGVPEIRIAQGSFAEGHFRQRILGHLSAPLNVADLQAAFNSLEAAPSIAAVRGRVRPGGDRAAVDVELVPADPLRFEVRVNNYRSPSIGAVQAELLIRHDNLTGRSDELLFAVGHTKGLDGGRLSYRTPRFGAWRAGAAVSRGDAMVVEAPFDAIDIRSETDVDSLLLERFFFDSPRRTLTATVGLERKRSETTLLGQPFDFTAASVNGRSRAGIISARLDYASRRPNRALALGIEARRSSSFAGDLLPDESFDVWRLQVGFVRAHDVGERRVLLRVDGVAQITSDTLPQFERYGLGGPGSVRAFRINHVLRDAAWELRTQLEVPFGVVTMYPFLDAGRARNSADAFNVRRSVRLSAAGLGLAVAKGGFTFRIEAGRRLNERERTGDELQDRGIHVGATYAF